MKKVSIIIACYNHANFLEQSVNSALNQDYENIEIIIANDGSTDNSLEVANNLSRKDKRIIVLSHENKGVVATRNEAISISTGNYILPLDSDDFLAGNDVVSCMVKAMEESGAVLCFGNYQSFGKETKFIKPQLKDLSNLLIANFIPITSMFTREVCEKVGGYSEKMSGGYEDWELVIRIAACGTIHKIDKTIFFYRTQKVSRNIAADKNNQQLFDCIVSNNPEIYSSNLRTVISVFKKYGSDLERKLKRQKQLKRYLVASLSLQLIVILFLF